MTQFTSKLMLLNMYRLFSVWYNWEFPPQTVSWLVLINDTKYMCFLKKTLHVKVFIPKCAHILPYCFVGHERCGFKFVVSNSNKYPEHILWNYPHVSLTRPHWWLVILFSGSGMTASYYLIYYWPMFMSPCALRITMLDRISFVILNKPYGHDCSETCWYFLPYWTGVWEMHIF